MMEAKNTSIGHWRKRFLIIPPLLLGALAIYYSSMLKDKPEQLIVDERASKVRVIKVTKQDVIPRAIGYGSVRPSRTWDAVAEVAGQVVWVSDQLKKGHRIQAGTEILRIDDANYQLILAQIEAELKVADVKDRTTRASLTIAEKDLKIASEDLNRKQDLRKKGTIAQAEVDAAERLMLGSESQVQNLHNTLALTAAEKRVLASKKSIAELDLDRTRLSTPFEVRITDVKIGEAQYANKGQLLFSADSLDVAEIEALFPIGVLRPLINASQTDPSNERPGVMGLQATVRLHTATHKVEWPARIDRVSSVIDPQTQSLGVVVAIDRPAEQAQPGQRPPLYRNTFVEVALFSAPL
ncbi:MAG: MFP transporter, partial [Candidatus Competibacteraceae bacterium]|nr:MFP transporter [Candidatus Competibacteraceae bacterium]